MRYPVWSEELFPPPFISLWTVCHSEEKQATFSLDTPPHHHHHHRLLLMQSSEGWHSNYAFFKRSYKSPHRATSRWQPNWSGIKLKRLQSLPKLCNAGKGTSADQRAGRADQRVQRRAPLVHLSRGLRLWGGGGQTQHWEQEETVYSILILREWDLCNGKLTLITVTW